MRSPRLSAVALIAWIGLAGSAPTTIESGVDTVGHIIAAAIANFQKPVAPDTSGDMIIIVDGPSPALDTTVFPGWSQALEVLAFALVVFVWVFPFSGLPLALYVVVADERRRRASHAAGSLSFSHVYACLMWQLLSVLLSAVVTAFVVVESGAAHVLVSPLAAYFGMQLVLGIYAVSCWRRRLDHASWLRRERRLFCLA